jgi:Transcription elongation factor, N-terminal
MACDSSSREVYASESAGALPFLLDTLYWILPGKDYEMRKGFTRKPQADEPATRIKKYITPSGLQRLKDEHRFLLTRERPAVTEVVAWAASNGGWPSLCGFGKGWGSRN